jgi:hypothetical protein
MWSTDFYNKILTSLTKYSQKILKFLVTFIRVVIDPSQVEYWMQAGSINFISNMSRIWSTYY